MILDYSEGHVIFDRYVDDSLKIKTRQKRASMSTEFENHPEMKLTMTLKELLSTTKTKRSLTCMLVQGLLEHFHHRMSFKLVVGYETKINGHVFEEEHTHEEADTLIPHKVLASVSEDPCLVS